MYKIILGFITLFASPVFALSNAEVRNAIQSYINTQEFPQQIDAVTTLVEIETTARGIAYIYQLSMSADQTPVATFKAVKTNAITNLCTNAAMTWYKSNDVEMIYYYLDNEEELISLYKISSSDC